MSTEEAQQELIPPLKSLLFSLCGATSAFLDATLGPCFFRVCVLFISGHNLTHSTSLGTIIPDTFLLIDWVCFVCSVGDQT